MRWQGLELLNFKTVQKMNKEQNVEGLNVSPAIAKPMLAAVYVATWQEEGDEPYQIRSDECKPKEKAGDSDWWFDEESLMFKRYWSYHHELYGNQYVHDEVDAVLLNGC